MKSLWDENAAGSVGQDLLALRAYTSNLIGANPNLVLHGGGNTSVKIKEKDFFGEEKEYLYVKGSGWDLSDIKPEGFAAVEMETLLKLARLTELSDTDMVREQRAAMKNPNSPSPSVEAILHALIPHRFVDHTHADSVVTLTNVVKDTEVLQQVFGERVLVVPYVMPGFVLARQIFEVCQDLNWSDFDAIVLKHHGVFTFSDDAKVSYENMISLVTTAEKEVQRMGGEPADLGFADFQYQEDSQEKDQKNSIAMETAAFRKQASSLRGAPVLCRWLRDSKEFAEIKGVENFSQLGPITPDHTIHTKAWPAVIKDNVEKSLMGFEKEYQKNFEKNAKRKSQKHGKNGGDELKILDSCPRWAIWPGRGVLSIADNPKTLKVVADINWHTCHAMKTGMAMGGWSGLDRDDLFDVEYWELEQAKLKKGKSRPEFAGRVAVVTGAASGIGRATAEDLRSRGACVVAIDRSETVAELFSGNDVLSAALDVRDQEAMQRTLNEAVQKFGGIDILVCNAGVFSANYPLQEMPEDVWQDSLEINLTSVQQLIRMAAPFLKLGCDPSVVIVGSKNVPAPGKGAGAYSVAKAGLTQLARVAALELGEFGINVNVLHPNAVFDTALWTDEVLEKRAKHYSMTVEEYKTNNVLKKEVSSKDVARLVCAVAGVAFRQTTGTQIPIDGGNDRVI